MLAFLEGWLPLPADCVQPHRVLEAFDLCSAAVAEIEPLTHGELSHHVRDEYLAGIGLGADARGELDSAAEQIVVLRPRLPGVEADPDTEGGLSPPLAV